MTIQELKIKLEELCEKDEGRYEIYMVGNYVTLVINDISQVNLKDKKRFYVINGS